MVGHGDVAGPGAQRLEELLACGFRLGRVDKVAGIHAGQRTDAVPAGFRAETADERELHVGPAPHFLGDVLDVVLVVDLVENGLARGIHGAEVAVVEVHGAVGADQGKMVGIEGAEPGEHIEVLQRVVAGDRHRAPGPLDHLVDLFQEYVALFDGEVLVHAAGNRAGAVNLLAGGRLDDLLPILAHHDALRGQLRELVGHANDVTGDRVGIEAEQEVGRAEMEEVEHMRLEHLPVMHQAPDLFRGGRQLLHTGDQVHGLDRRQVMAHRADAAEALDQNGDLPVGPPLDEALEAAELHNVQPGLLHFLFFVEKDGDFPMPFHAGDGLDDDLSGRGIYIGHGGFLNRT